jgi:hypothetical protein
MTIKEKMISCIQQITGDSNADLWTLSFNDNDANADISRIGFRGAAGNVRIHEGRLRTNGDVDNDAKKVIKYSSGSK